MISTSSAAVGGASSDAHHDPRLGVEDRRRGLGSLAWWWIEHFTVLGDGGQPDKPTVLSPEYAQFVMNCYALDADGRRRFDHAFLSRPKGANKSGMAYALGSFEFLGPCRFDHWAEEGEYYEFLGCRYWYEPGEPVGRPVQNPQIACLATSEDQTGKVYARMLYNCQHGPLSDLRSQGLDPANTRILHPDGGWVKPYAVNARAADGGLETFAIVDESHLFVEPKVKKLKETVERNLPKRYLDSEPWMLETTTMYRPGEGSVAEETYRTAWDWHEGKVKRGSMRLYFDHRFASLAKEDFTDRDKVMHALYEAYGSVALSDDGKDHLLLPDGTFTTVGPDGRDPDGHSLLEPGVEPGPSKDGWQSMDAIYELLMKPTTDPGDSIRYYLNSLASTSDAWLDEAWIAKHTVGGDITLGLRGRALQDAWMRVIDPRDEITLGFDGSVSDDSTALVGCRVRDGLLFLIKLEGAPDGPAKKDWRVDRDAFDGFQSTPPRGRRRRGGHGRAGRIAISIHASTREATARDARKPSSINISIHASTREATACQAVRHVPSEGFQSTPPRGRRRVGFRHRRSRTYFNPRLHEGGDPRQAAARRPRRISIHASTREATSTGRPPRTPERISIHASTREATESCETPSPGSLFQSTPPRGRRPGYDPGTGHGKTVFQSTPPRGRRHITAAISIPRIGFQSTPPRGRRHTTNVVKEINEQFQSTPPRGRRRHQHRPFHPRREISIHASTREATRFAVERLFHIGISIHASTREATRLHRSQPRRLQDFNPRLHEGADPQLVLLRSMLRIFQATPPRGRRPGRSGPPPRPTHFNPRLHEGGDMHREFGWNPLANFNPRLHEGGDACFFRARTACVRFQSTPPRGRRHARKQAARRSHEISIHASTREATTSP